jgi:hypothetical protein
MFVLEYLKVLGFGGQAGLNASLDEQWQVRYQFKCICRLSFMQFIDCGALCWIYRPEILLSLVNHPCFNH